MSARTVTEDDLVLFRAGSGTIHLGVRLGRIHDAVCCTVIDSPHVRTWTGDAAAEYAADRARYVCADCEEISGKPWPVIRQITGWQ